MNGKNRLKPWKNMEKSIEPMADSMKTMEKSMKTLGKSMNTMEKLMNSANGKFQLQNFAVSVAWVGPGDNHWRQTSMAVS